MVAGLIRLRGHAFLLFIGVTILLGNGCGRGRDSGIPEGIADGKMLESAVALQDGRVMPSTRGFSRDGAAVSVEGVYLVKTGSGTSGLFMGHFKEQVESFILMQGAGIYGRGTTGSPEDLGGFHFDYAWENKMGIVRVNAVETTNGVTVILFCYEHRR